MTTTISMTVSVGSTSTLSIQHAAMADAGETLMRLERSSCMPGIGGGGYLWSGGGVRGTLRAYAWLVGMWRTTLTMPN